MISHQIVQGLLFSGYTQSADMHNLMIYIISVFIHVHIFKFNCSLEHVENGNSVDLDDLARCSLCSYNISVINMLDSSAILDRRTFDIPDRTLHVSPKLSC